MSLKAVFVALCFAMLACRASAQEAVLGPPIVGDAEDPVTLILSDAQDPGIQDNKQKTDKGKQPDMKAPDFKIDPTPPPQDLLGLNALENAMGQSQTGFNPHMMGDFFVLFALQRISVCSLQTTTTTFTPSFSAPSVTSTSTCMVTQTRTAYVPILSLGAFNVAENESPRPQDRVFGFYNYFGDLHGPEFGPGVVTTSPQTTTATVPASGTITTTSTTSIPSAARVSLDLNREVIGFEKTFLDGRASLEVRLPFLQAQGGEYGSSIVGDLTLVSRYALLLDNYTGDVFTVGLALTLPSGGGVETVDGNFRDTFIQPWFGYIVNFTNFYIQGIHSIAVPTSSQDVTLMFNDVGIDFWLYRGPSTQFLSAVVPTLEAHLTTPLNHRDIDNCNPLFIEDVLVLTGGVHFGFYANTTLTVGAAVPVTSPSPFSFEGFVQLNWRF